MTEWDRIEGILDDRTTAHSCAFCGGRIPEGDDTRWSLAVRRLSGETSVVWVHGRCFLERLQPKIRLPFEEPKSGAPPI